jgi:hypothetical protein
MLMRNVAGAVLIPGVLVTFSKAATSFSVSEVAQD